MVVKIQIVVFWVFMEAENSSEMFVSYHITTWYQNPEDHNMIKMSKIWNHNLKG